MLFAQESTAETHRFNRPRKKPHRAKAKPTHRQGPLFADMLHPTTPYQREYAHHVCGSTTIYNTKGGARLYCHRRDCPVCFKRRYQKIARRIFMYAKTTGNKLYWQRVDNKNHAKVVRSIKAKRGDYVCFPMINKYSVEQEIIISTIPANVPGRQRISTKLVHLEANLAVWTKTPEGRKISFSSGFKVKDLSPDTGKKINYFTRLSLNEIAPHAMAVGGVIEKRSKSYIKWHNVDPEKLTNRLVENDIVAYQITMDKTLFEDARNAEDVMRNDLAKSNHNSKSDYDAIPLDAKGHAVAPPVKLRQLLRNSIAIDLHKNSLAVPSLAKTEVQTTSPPPS